MTKESLELMKALGMEDISRSCSLETDQLYADVLIMHKIVQDIRDRMANIERALSQANATEEDEQIWSCFKTIKQRAASLSKKAAKLSDDFDILTEDSFNFDQMAKRTQLMIKVINNPTPEDTLLLKKIAGISSSE